MFQIVGMEIIFRAANNDFFVATEDHLVIGSLELQYIHNTMQMWARGKKWRGNGPFPTSYPLLLTLFLGPHPSSNSAPTIKFQHLHKYSKLLLNITVL